MNKLIVDQQLTRSVPGWKTGSEDLSQESRRAERQTGHGAKGRENYKPFDSTFSTILAKKTFLTKKLDILFLSIHGPLLHVKIRETETNKQNKTKKNENLIYMFSEKNSQKDHFQVHFSYFGFNFEQTRTCNSNKHIDQQFLAIMVLCRRKNSGKTNEYILKDKGPCDPSIFDPFCLNFEWVSHQN